MEDNKKLVATAYAELNYLEKKDSSNLDDKYSNAGDNNYTKYARDCFPSLQGYSWCCMFVWWCFYKTFGETQAKSMVGDKTAKCSVMADNMAKLGCKKIEDKNIQIGDIVFFKNPISHIGIVYSVGSNSFTTIEGNTSQSSSSSSVNEVVANGGGVFIRAYNYGIERINCFYRPKYASVSKTETVQNSVSAKNATTDSVVQKNEITDTESNYVIRATNVNIRAGAGTEYKKLGMETKGYKFIKKGEAKDSNGYVWFNFKYNNDNGYIRSDFVGLDT
jgi:hypothetical protein